MDKVLWYFQTSSWFELLGNLWLPILVGVLLYYSSYVPIFVRAVVRKIVRPPDRTLPADRQHAVLILMPTLLRNRGELRGLQGAIESVLDNGYPGPVVLCPSIDEANAVPRLFAELRRWIDAYEAPAGATLMLAASRVRVGKAMAIETGVNRVHEAVASGEIHAFPPLVCSMDADSKLGEKTLERLVERITRVGSFSRKRPLIVGANICVSREHFWMGWRGFFTVRGQIALQVAREYMTSISLARNNWRLIPVTTVSGAMYCTWSELFLEAPRYAGFMTTLRFRHLVRWWWGGGPPSLAESKAEHLPEAMTGPGDDTWMAWLAMSAQWKNGRISLELPKTPLHALSSMIYTYIFRHVAYVPEARVYTKTPTTFRGLFRQRVRWNSSRIWLLCRFGWSSFFQWRFGAMVYLDIAVLVTVHGIILLALLLWPVLGQPSQWLAIFILVNVFYAFIRLTGTLLAMLQDDNFRGQWQKLLAVPISGPYHIFFNIFTTIYGFIKDLLFYGVNTDFAPESTLIRAGTGRVALLYRLRRAAGLTLRAAIYGDVPFGRFWFGWHETHWTGNGYHGWTDPAARRRFRWGIRRRKS